MEKIRVKQDYSKKVPEGFNKIKLTYSSSQPVKLVVNYNEKDGTTSEDYFFLEEGEKVFEGLILGYLDEKKVFGIDSIETWGLRDESLSFEIKNVEYETFPVVSKDTYFLENEYYKVGVRLIWGGGVNFIQDKHNPVPGLTNIVNQCDTGRLIQQSYYGTGKNDEIDWGEFNNSNHWPYNPVQGGDRGGCHSRLIDIKMFENKVYIKSQPMDWGKIGYKTPSYMENNYILDGNMIRVDNRFTDFSGWEHPCNHQEVPAFYTVSYLDRFTWYDGVNSWQDEPLTNKDDLMFWGDPKYSADCFFSLRKSAKEVWCAWVNAGDDYGIGLFVPECDSFTCGKNAYNKSKDPDDPATNYVAPLNRIKIISFVPIEYSYLMTCGSVSEIRSRFKANKDFAKNEGLRKNGMNMRMDDNAKKY